MVSIFNYMALHPNLTNFVETQKSRQNENIASSLFQPNTGPTDSAKQETPANRYNRFEHHSHYMRG